MLTTPELKPTPRSKRRVGASGAARAVMRMKLPVVRVGPAIEPAFSMVVIAALVGASGLGVPVIRALNTVNTSLGFESGFVIVVVAIMLDRMLRVKQK